MEMNKFLRLVEAKGLTKCLPTERYTSASNVKYTAFKEGSDGSLSLKYYGMESGCFGGLSDAGKNTAFIIVHIRKSPHVTSDNIPDDIQATYLNWLFNDSPLASVFVSKDGNQAVEQGYAVVDCKTPGNIMMLGMISVRHIWEANYKVRMWYELTKNGYNPDLAYLISHGLHTSDVNPNSSVALADANSHSGLYINHLGWKFVKNFLNRVTDFHRKTTYFATGYYNDMIDTGVENCYSGRNDRLQPEFRDYVYAEIKKYATGAPKEVVKGYISAFANTLAAIKTHSAAAQSYPKSVVVAALLAGQEALIKKIQGVK